MTAESQQRYRPQGQGTPALWVSLPFAAGAVNFLEDAVDSEGALPESLQVQAPMLTGSIGAVIRAPPRAVVRFTPWMMD